MDPVIIPEITAPIDAVDLLKPLIKKTTYSVEYFHIYTDEEITPRHKIGIEYLKAIEESWNIDHKRVVMIDNYNPTAHVLDADKVLEYLKSQNMMPDYWAYEGDLVVNAQKMLNSLTSTKLKKNYDQYIDKHNKYPCSLLTATWYLTRLGRFSPEGVIHGADKSNNELFEPVERLINLLPQDYKPVEARARELIVKSEYSADADRIQNLFYPIDSGRELDLF